jgi:hypothetical protein
MTETPMVLSARARRLAATLAIRPRRRVRLAELWELLDQSDPSTRTDIRRRRVMAELIAELAAAEVVELPAAGSYDHLEEPPLPRFLTLTRPTVNPGLPKSVVWHPTLAWASQIHVTRSQMDSLERVNRWLHSNRDQLVIPSRERSLEIFSHEKALDRLISTSIFGSGRLNLGLLRCRRVAPPLHIQPCGDGDLLLIIENSDTFDSVLTALRDNDDHRVGLVGWGAGTGFEASVLSIARIDRHITEIRYFGDIDENGLRVPSNASALAEVEGLPTVRPANGLYTAMLQLGRPQAGQRKLSAEAAASLASWLGPEHQEAVMRLLTAGDRMAQEAVGLAHLSRHDDWRQDLT